MKRTYCGACGGEVVEGSQCPTMVDCPDCGATANHPCKRPSGHKAMRMHQSRWERAENLDAQRGITYE